MPTILVPQCFKCWEHLTIQLQLPCFLTTCCACLFPLCKSIHLPLYGLICLLGQTHSAVGQHIWPNWNVCDHQDSHSIGCDLSYWWSFDIIFGDEDIYPFVVFLQGCDFYDSESTIGDRIRTIASLQPMNQINLYWKQIRKNKFVGGSYYMRGHSMKDSPGSSDWGSQEMKDVMLSISQHALEYYISKYGKWKVFNWTVNHIYR